MTINTHIEVDEVTGLYHLVNDDVKDNLVEGIGNNFNEALEALMELLGHNENTRRHSSFKCAGKNNYILIIMDGNYYW